MVLRDFSPEVMKTRCGFTDSAHLLPDKVPAFYNLNSPLDKTNPKIWKEILVPKDITFYKLHHTIQIVMGWKNAHLFEFSIEGFRVGVIYDGLEEMDDGHIMDSKETKLIELIGDKSETFKYWYDFGDSWNHSVVIEKHESVNNSHQLPFCIAGEFKCPPENCGGIPGFSDFLSIIADKKHKERKEMIRWAGGKYEPTEFDLDKINKQLKSIDRYIKSIEE